MSFCQLEITGRIVDENNFPLSLANIALINIDDSIKIEYGSISDLKGFYKIENVLENEYILHISMLGYVTYSDHINITKTDTSINIVLKPSIHILSEAIIEGSNITNEINKTTFVITNIDKKKASSSFDLVEIIPQIRVDNSANNILTIDGKQIMILINGLRSSAQELISITPDNVKKIEYYDIPPARYSLSNYASVINVITKKNRIGSSFVADLQNALLTGFGNDMISLKYNNKNTQFSFFYNLSYRDYSEKVVNEVLSYSINEEKINTESYGIRSPFSYTQNIFNLNFVHIKDSNYTFSLKFSPTFTNGNYLSNYNITKTINTNTLFGIGRKESQFSESAPNINIYFSKILPNNQVLTFDVIGSYFENKNNYNRKEISSKEDTILFDKILTSSNKRSVIIESNYNKHFKLIEISVGAKYYKGYFAQKIVNSFNNNTYVMETSEKHIYSEVIGKFKKFSYQLSAGLTHSSFTEDKSSNNYSFFSFTPFIRLSYPLTKKTSIRTYYRITPHAPYLSQLSLNSYIIDYDIIYSGNPELVPYNTHDFSVDYRYNISRLFISTQIQFSVSTKPILSEYSYYQNLILLSNRNQSWKREFVWSVFVKHNPFKSNWLQYSLYSAIFSFQNRYNSGHLNSVFDYLIFASLDLNYRNFTVKLKLQNSYNKLESQTINSTPFDSRASIQYKYKHWNFMIGIWNPLSKTLHTETRTVKNSLVNNISSIDIYDNGRMIYFKLYFNINLGKKFNDSLKIIDNTDNDPGSFRIK